MVGEEKTATYSRHNVVVQVGKEDRWVVESGTTKFVVDHLTFYYDDEGVAQRWVSGSGWKVKKNGEVGNIRRHGDVDYRTLPKAIKDIVPTRFVAKMRGEK